MLTIELRFPTGKWHATPWGRQVNEGAVEWPPAPWRILRALLATWHHKHHDISEEQMRIVIDALVENPVYRLPRISQGHTRHYMPAPENKTKIFDAFIAVSPQDPLLVHWPDVTLDADSEQLLRRLLESMSYFGRAESWVCASIGEWDGQDANAAPLNGHGVQPGEELVRLLAPTNSHNYTSWRSGKLEEIRDRKLAEKRQKAEQKGKPPEKEKLTPKELKALETTIPAGLFEALHVETNDLRSAGWNRPPGSQWVDYVRVKPLTAITPKSGPRKRRSPTVARFAIAGAVRPRLTEALWIGERARQFAMGYSKKQNGGNCSPVFSGKDADGAPRRNAESSHSHAHFLCESSGLNNRGRITHLTIFAPESFSVDDEKALSRFSKMWGHGGHDLQLVLLGLGSPDDFGGMDETKGESRILDESMVWISRTPFVPADRLRRRYQLDDPLEQRRCELDLARIVRAELARRPWLSHHAASLQKAEAIFDRNESGTMLGGTRTPWLKFRRERQRGGGRRGDAHGYGLRLIFSEPVRGPIVFGYGCHFGLGQFVPE